MAEAAETRVEVSRTGGKAIRLVPASPFTIRRQAIDDAFLSRNRKTWGYLIRNQIAGSWSRFTVLVVKKSVLTFPFLNKKKLAVLCGCIAGLRPNFLTQDLFSALKISGGKVTITLSEEVLLPRVKTQPIRAPMGAAMRCWHRLMVALQASHSAEG